MIKIHIPLWKSYRNEEIKRLYLRFEVSWGQVWASRGRNKNGSLKIYRRGLGINSDISICHGKILYPITYDKT